ncbi:MAG: hypothetical protein ACLRUZ_07640 [Faecalimonas sp.]
MGLATVYRTLQLVTGICSWWIRINLDDGCVRYEIGHLIEGGKQSINHHHLDMQEMCNKVVPLKMISWMIWSSHIEEATGFPCSGPRVEILRICRCRRISIVL